MLWSGISAGLPELVSVPVKNNLFLGYKKRYCSQIKVLRILDLLIIIEDQKKFF